MFLRVRSVYNLIFKNTNPILIDEGETLIMKKLLDTLKAIDTKIFGKHRVLANIILGACLAAVVVVIAVNVKINHDEAAKAQGTYIEDSVKDNKKSDGSYIIKGEVSEKDGVTTIVADDGTYIIKDGCLYKLGADGKEEKLSSDLSKVTVYDKTGNKNNVVDGKLVADTKDNTKETVAPANDVTPSGEAVLAPEEQQVDVGEDNGTTQPAQTDLPWVYSYPTYTGYYKNSETGWVINCHIGTAQGINAEQKAQLDMLSWQVATYEISDEEFAAQVNAVLGGVDEDGYGGWSIYTFVDHRVQGQHIKNAQEKAATQGYIFDVNSSYTGTEYHNYYIFYDAAVDEAEVIEVVIG